MEVQAEHAEHAGSGSGHVPSANLSSGQCWTSQLRVQLGLRYQHGNYSYALSNFIATINWQLAPLTWILTFTTIHSNIFKQWGRPPQKSFAEGSLQYLVLPKVARLVLINIMHLHSGKLPWLCGKSTIYSWFTYQQLPFLASIHDHHHCKPATRTIINH